MPAIGAALLVLVAATRLVDRSSHVVRPDPALDGEATAGDGTRFASDVPLDPSSPWPKLRADARQIGRSPVRPAHSDRQPGTFATGQGVFSSPVTGGEALLDDVYVPSGDAYLYALDR